MGIDMVKDYQTQMRGERIKSIKDMLESGKNIKRSQDRIRSYKNEVKQKFIDDLGLSEEEAEVAATRLSTLAENIVNKEGSRKLPNITEEGILQLENIIKNMETGGKKARELNADGGRIGYKLGTFKKIGEGVKSFTEFLNKKNPVQAYTDYLKSIKDKTLKANKTGKFTDLPLAEVGIPAAGGMLINRAVKKKLEAMSKEDVERKKERDDKADGGRIGFKKGMDRRTFMKMVGGITALPFLGKFFKGAEVAAPVAEKAAEVASGAPAYFFNLVDRIRALGKRFDGPKERSESYSYKDYQMDIDFDTGKIDIKKTKEAMIPGGDEAGISEEVYMTYKPGMIDETTKGRKTVDEYEEFTARPDIDGKMKDVEDGVPDEVVREGSIGKEELEQEIIDQIAREKKASGGLAYMLGE